MSFVFFDTETTGLKPGFDQILHFAAVRTDAELNEIERFECRSRLLPHVLPHPMALCTNGLPISKLRDPSLPSHYSMVMEIRDRLLRWSPAIFLGYNSIKFDEEMLRHALFQTLHPAYLTSNHNNSRADVWGLMMAAAAVSPAALNVPIGSNGKSIFRLTELAIANGVHHDNAHDALSDALTTLDLCRIIKGRSSELWQRFVRFSKKATVAEFIDAEEGFFLTEFFSNQAFHTPVVMIGRDPDQANARLCLSLNDKVETLAGMTDKELGTELAKKPCPIRRLRVNAAPTVTAFFEAPSVMIEGIDVEVLEGLARRIKGDLEFCARLVTAYISVREPFPPSPRLEEQLYSAFPGPDDERRMIEFHETDWSHRLSIVDRFDDPRLRRFGVRLVYLHARATLPDAVRTEIESELSSRLIDDAAGSLTLQKALDAIACTEDSTGILTEYGAYLRDRMKKVELFRARESDTKNGTLIRGG